MPPLIDLSTAMLMLASAVAAVLAAIVTFNGRNKDEPVFIVWAAAGLMGVMSLFAVCDNHEEREAIACVTTHGVLVRDDGGYIPPCDQWQAEVDRVVALYEQRVPRDLWRIENLDGLYVRVQPTPVGYGNGQVGAISQPGTGITMFLDPVDEGRPLNDTQLAHELGHFLVFRDAKTEEVSEKYEVP